jgi:hypothetical protein
VLTSGFWSTQAAVLSAAGALGVALVAGAGYEIGRHHAPTVTWHRGEGYIGDHQVGVTTSGWSYGFVDSVPRWIDTAGGMHTDSWPDCMSPAGTSEPVTFATVTVTVAGVTQRQVVLVDCRGG